MNRIVLSLLLVGILVGPAPAQKTREDKVRDDKKKVEAEGFWMYNDLPVAFARAKKESKPLLVVLRCIPCEECVKLDDELIDKNPRLRPLLEKFVRVRVVSTNGLDLSLFQYDYDQSFAVFLLNADGTIYGRFGTRSHRTNWVGDVSVEGLARAMQGALALHADYPKNKTTLSGKRGAPPLYSAPEKFPGLAKYSSKLDYQGKVVPSCIHCHQVGEAIRQVYRNRKQPILEEVLFPYPHPKSLGLTFDPKEVATVLGVEKDTPASAAGFKPGDQIKTLAGQPLLSIGDVQWVLHGASPSGARIKAEVVRDGKPVSLTLTLPKGWRQRDDISWRASTWELRRWALGGQLLESLETRPDGVPADGMALHVKHVGQYAPHNVAKVAGFQVGDVIVSFGGKTNLLRETDLIAYSLRTYKPGDSVKVGVIRKGKRLDFTLPIKY